MYSQKVIENNDAWIGNFEQAKLTSKTSTLAKVNNLFCLRIQSQLNDRQICFILKGVQLGVGTGFAKGFLDVARRVGRKLKALGRSPQQIQDVKESGDDTLSQESSDSLFVREAPGPKRS